MASASSSGPGTPASASGGASPAFGAAARVPFPRQLSERYRLGEELGRGAYGRVYRAVDIRSGLPVAVKQISLDRVSSGALASLVTEVELLKALNHPHVVQYYGSFRARTHLYIIMEMIEGGSLAAAVKPPAGAPLPEPAAASYIAQVLEGLAYLHDQGVVHRDIKGANILTTRDGVAKLADFGVAARLADVGCDAGGGGGDGEHEEEDTQPAGTPYWMAPEVIELRTVTTASDVWSLGCLAVELVTGTPPYYDLQPLSALYNIVQNAHPPLPAGVSPSLADFLLRCFDKDPARRPSAKALLDHPWVSGIMSPKRSMELQVAQEEADAADAADAAAQVEFLARLDADADGAALLDALDALSLADEEPREAEVRRQAASLRILAAPGARSLVEEAAAAASARSLAGHLAASESARRAFIAADGLCGLRELLDSSSERVLAPALDLVLALTADDPQATEMACVMGLLPAALRMAGPTHPIELRLRAARLAAALPRASAGGAHMLVACQGVPFFMSMMDDAPQSAEQRELLGAAASGLWALLQRAGGAWPVSANAYLRLMAHHGLPQRLVKAVPWVLKAAAEERQGSGQVAAPSPTPAAPSPSPPRPGLLGGPSNRIVPEETLVIATNGVSLSTSSDAASEAGAAAAPSSASRLLESLVGLFAALCRGDAVVKARVCALDVVNPFFGFTVRMPTQLQAVALRAVRRLATDQSVASALEAANGVAYIVAQLPRVDAPGLQADALCALRDLCQLSRSRQDATATAGAVPWLCRLALQPPAGLAEAEAEGAHAAAVAVLCALAHAGPRPRAEMWAHGGLDALLQLLKEDANQVAVLEALASWLDAELPRVEGRLLEGAALTRLTHVVAAAASAPGQEQLPSLLSPLGRMLSRSPRMAVELTGAGLAARCVEALRRPSAPAALALMETLQALYEAHPRPKEFLAAHRVGPALAALAQGDQVLVKTRATGLLQAFNINAVI